ncbi:MAG: hypothetical protein PHC61_08215 [Chitinivibrionales bacterium]|nr:hypothetical protein [Chitinivibrionales bacterium]
MNSPISLKKIFCVALCLAGQLWLASCTAPLGMYARQDYCHPAFNGGALADQSVLILPLFTKYGFDTSQALSPVRQASLLASVKKRVVVKTDRSFEKTFITPAGKAMVDSFYLRLSRSDVIGLQSLDSVWKHLDARYCLAVRVLYAVSIKSFSGVRKKKVHLEGELWDADNMALVWRAEVTGATLDPAVTDAEFFRSALSSMYAALPQDIPAINEKNW